MKFCRENPDLVKIGTEYQDVYMKTQVFFFTSLAATCVAQRWTEHTVDLIWLQFQYLLHCWQAHTYVKNTNRTLRCLSMLTIITRTRHDVTLHVCCLSCYSLTSILILSSDLPPMSSKRWRFFRFPHRNPVCISLHLATRPAHRVLLICSPSKYFVRRTIHDTLYKTISWILRLFLLSLAQMSSPACYYPVLSAMFFARNDVPIFTSIQCSRQFMVVYTLIFMFLWLQTHFIF